MNLTAAPARLLSVVRWAVVAAVGAALLTPVLLTVLTPYRLVVVDGGSMEPTYAYGDVLVVETGLNRDAAQAALEPGQVVVVGDDHPSYMHRVVATRSEGGTLVATLRGDANSAADPMSVTADDVHGIPAAQVGGPTGDLVRWAISGTGRIVLGVVLVAALAFALRRPGR